MRTSCLRTLAAGAFLAAGLVTITPQAHAGGGVLYEFKAGVLAHDVDNLWSGSRKESGAALNLEATFVPSLPLWRGQVRPALGGTLSTAGDTSKLYLDARWEVDLGRDVYFVTGVGLAVHDGKLKRTHRDRKALGSRLLLHFPIELGYRLDERHSLSLFFDHVSNAWTASPNEGMDTLGLRYGYRF